MKKETDKIYTVLSIAGSDSSGGAGIQADIKTCCALGVYATTVITALTAQNTMGVQGIQDIKPEFVRDQIVSVIEDIRPDAVKVGMLGNSRVAIEVAKCIKEYELPNVVVDPVLVSSSGHSLSGEIEETIDVIVKELAPLATLLTPNLPEAAALLGFPMDYEDPQTYPIRLMGLTGCKAVLVKGGHGNEKFSTDYLVYRSSTGELTFEEFSQPRIETPNNHGTGCTLSSAIACFLSKGESLTESIKMGKLFVTEALRGSRNRKIGKGTGPLDFLFTFDPNQE